MNENKIKIGFIVDSLKVSKYDLDIIKWVNNSPEFYRPILIQQDVMPSNFLGGFIRFIKNKGIFSLVDKVLFNLISKVEQLILNKNNNHFDHLSRFGIDFNF